MVVLLSGVNVGTVSPAQMNLAIGRNVADSSGARVDAARKRDGTVVPEASDAGLARWSIRLANAVDTFWVVQVRMEKRAKPASGRLRP